MMWVDDLFNKHKLVRRMTVIWAVTLVTIVVMIAMTNMALITAPVATVVGSVVGLVATVLGFYMKGRQMDKDS